MSPTEEASRGSSGDRVPPWRVAGRGRLGTSRANASRSWPLSPELRAANRGFRNIKRRQPCDHERLALKFVPIEFCQKLPIELGVRITERTKEPARDTLEKRGRAFRHGTDHAEASVGPKVR
jgi:hypothetical protein